MLTAAFREALCNRTTPIFKNGDGAGRNRSYVRTTCENLASTNSPSFAVALNCGIGSGFLNEQVKAFERLQIVRG